jgi:hypothetical protein
MARAGSVLPLIDFMPKLAEQLQEHPEQVIADFEDIRAAFTKPEGIRMAVTGNVLALDKPRSVWAKHFDFIGVRKTYFLAVVCYSSFGAYPTGKCAGIGSGLRKFSEQAWENPCSEGRSSSLLHINIYL